MEDINSTPDATGTTSPAEPTPTSVPSTHRSSVDQAMDKAKQVLATITGRAKS